MKKIIYISLFTLLGILLQVIIHALVEIWYGSLLISDFARYSFGLSWRQWFLIHRIGTVILTAFGIVFGFWQGKFWWKRIYEGRQNIFPRDNV